MAKKVIVTGGMGYIGSHTIIELIRKGEFEPISVDSCINSSEETIDHIEAATGKRIHNIKIDLCDKKAVDEALKDHTNIAGIIHFAALKSVPDSVADPSLYYRNNINSLVNILDWAKEHKVVNIIFSSSCSVYGNVQELPVTEDTPLSIAESPYAHTKQIGEHILKDYAKIWPEMRVIALRYFNPVGADKTGLNGENPINPPTALVPYITQTAAGIFPKLTVFGTDYNTRDGSCIRDYIHVSDIAIAHLMSLDYLLADKQQMPYDVFNLGMGEGVTVIEAVNAFEEVNEVKLNYVLGPRRPGDVEAIYSNISKVKTTIGWEPQLGIEDMVGSAWTWQKHISNIEA